MVCTLRFPNAVANCINRQYRKCLTKFFRPSPGRLQTLTFRDEQVSKGNPTEGVTNKSLGRERFHLEARSFRGDDDYPPYPFHTGRFLREKSDLSWATRLAYWYW